MTIKVGILDEISVRSPEDKARLATEAQQKSQDTMEDRKARLEAANRPVNTTISRSAAESAIAHAEIVKRARAVSLPVTATLEDIDVAERAKNLQK